MNKEKLSAFCHFYSQDFPWPRRPWATPSLVRDAPWIWCIKPPSTGLRPLAKSNYGVVNHGKPKNHHYIAIPNTFKTFNTSICVTGVNRVFFFVYALLPVPSAGPVGYLVGCLGKLPPSGMSGGLNRHVHLPAFVRLVARAQGIQGTGDWKSWWLEPWTGLWLSIYSWEWKIEFHHPNWQLTKSVIFFRGVGSNHQPECHGIFNGIVMGSSDLDTFIGLVLRGHFQETSR